jgi:hypothetical protein
LNKNWKNEGLAVRSLDGSIHVSTKGMMQKMCSASVNAQMEVASLDQHKGKKVVYKSEDSIFDACIDGYSDGLDRKQQNAGLYINKDKRNEYYGIDGSTPAISDEANNVK